MIVGLCVRVCVIVRLCVKVCVIVRLCVIVVGWALLVLSVVVCEAVCDCGWVGVAVHPLGGGGDSKFRPPRTSWPIGCGTRAMQEEAVPWGMICSFLYPGGGIPLSQLWASPSAL